MPAAHARRQAPILRGRGRLYDTACAMARVGLGCAFISYALGLRGRESELGEHMSGSVLAPLGLLSPALPALLVTVSVAFVMGLLTRVTGPLLASTVLLGHLAPASAELAPFSGWGTNALALAACLLIVAIPGQWSWDRLVLAPPPPARTRIEGRHTGRSRAKDRTVSRRRPDHPPPLLYPGERADSRRPSEL